MAVAVAVILCKISTSISKRCTIERFKISKIRFGIITIVIVVI